MATVTTLVADLASSEDLARLSSRVGEVDVTMLVNNAGGGKVYRIEGVRTELHPIAPA